MELGGTNTCQNVATSYMIRSALLFYTLLILSIRFHILLIAHMIYYPGEFLRQEYLLYSASSENASQEQLDRLGSSGAASASHSCKKERNPGSEHGYLEEKRQLMQQAIGNRQ